jgi:hypothetical protein
MPASLRDEPRDLADDRLVAGELANQAVPGFPGRGTDLRLGYVIDDKSRILEVLGQICCGGEFTGGHEKIEGPSTLTHGADTASHLRSSKPGRVRLVGDEMADTDELVSPGELS